MNDQLEPDPYPAIRSDLPERDYLLKRASDHERLAEKADDASTRAIHRNLQQLYRERADRMTLVLTD